MAWSMAHLGVRVVHAGQVARAIATLLANFLSRKPCVESYDLIGGLVGVGVYAMEQRSDRLAIRLIGQIVDRLEEIAERKPEGITWFTPPQLLPEWQRQLCPNGYYNMGVAHGVSGVIAFLTQVCAADQLHRLFPAEVRRKARALLDGAISWLLAQKCAGIATTTFPNWVAPGITPTPTRVAWCYGDLGIAVVLLSAARCLNDVCLERDALGLARRVAVRSLARTGVKDSGLCHGAAGVGHLFNRLFQATGDLRLKAAARKWFRHTLQMRRPSEGIGGFSAFRIDGSMPELGILEGAAGIALALLAAATSVEPAWDRMLLMSLPEK